MINRFTSGKSINDGLPKTNRLPIKREDQGMRFSMRIYTAIGEVQDPDRAEDREKASAFLSMFDAYDPSVPNMRFEGAPEDQLYLNKQQITGAIAYRRILHWDKNFRALEKEEKL